MKKKNSQFSQQRRVLQWVSVAVICCIAGMTLYQQVFCALQPHHDKLAYTTHDGSSTTLMLYDAATNETRTLINDYQGGHFNFSSDGRIAYQDWDEDDTRQIYVLDTTIENSEPVNITSELMDGASLVGNAWSPDSQYLAYQTDDVLYLWDGQQSIDVTPDFLKEQREQYDFYHYRVGWSTDGRLAFHVLSRLASAEDPIEFGMTKIFLWDGKRTVNISQNSTGYDSVPAWSQDGQLAFYSVRMGKHGIWIWDGVSYQDGLPNASSFTFVDIESDTLLWTHDNRLIIDSVDQLQRTEYQVQLWDGELVKTIIPLPDAMNYGVWWNPDGRLAFVSSSDEGSYVIVRDEHNQEIAKFPGGMAVSWSNDGQLAYAGGGRSFMVWDGTQHVQLAESTWETFAQWQNGDSIHFSFWLG